MLGVAAMTLLRQQTERIHTGSILQYFCVHARTCMQAGYTHHSEVGYTTAYPIYTGLEVSYKQAQCVSVDAVDKVWTAGLWP